MNSTNQHIIPKATARQNYSPQCQYDNHLGSASLELDHNANVISYEEYHPFGTTSYRSGRTETEASLKRYDHSTGGFNEISAPSANVDRYIYTEKQGWIDMQHFFIFAAFAVCDADEIPNAAIASYGSEAIQDYINDNASGFSYEDLVSNKMGFEFGLQYGSAIVAGDITIQDALTQYMNALGAVDPEQAPNFEFIPYAPINDNRNTKFDGNPLIGNALRNAAKNVYNLKAGEVDTQGMSSQKKIDKAHEQIGR